MKKFTFKNTLIFMSVILLGALPVKSFGQTEISTAQGLKGIANNLAGSYKLTADITLTEPWAPIGTDATPFTGTIDGNGHVIKGLLIESSSINKVGFISVANGATIQKLGLVGVNIQGRQDVGAFIGKGFSSKVKNCYSTGKLFGYDHVGGIVGGTGTSAVAKSEISNCYSTAYIYSTSYQAGGILGTAVDVDITNVYFSGYCMAKSSNSGGLVSLIDGHSDVWGVNANTISNSVALAPAVDGGKVRRILANKGDNDAGTFFTLTNNFAFVDMLLNGKKLDPADADLGAALAQGESKTLADLKTNNFYTTTLGWSTDSWTFTQGSFPVLKWQTLPADVDQILGLPTSVVKCEVGIPDTLQLYSAFGQTITCQSSAADVATVEPNGAIHPLKAGTTTITVSTAGSSAVKAVSSTFTINVISITGDIRTADDLDNIRYKLDGTFTLQNDITVEADWTPISGFSGTLNGNGFVIRGLKYNNVNTDKVGLFALTSGAKISKLGIENARLIGNADVGGIVGTANDGTEISQCYVANSYIEGRDHVGSIAGAIRQKTIISNCYGTATVSSRQYQAGGIAGIFQEGTIDKCFFSGIVAIQTGSSNVGGMTSLLDGGDETSNIISNSVNLAPYMLGGTVCRIFANANGKGISLVNNYARIDVKRGSSINTLSGVGTDDENYGPDKLHGTNVSIEDSKTKAFYKNVLTWDMDNVWSMVGEGTIYPILKWQKTPVTPSVLGVPSDAITKKGESLKVKVYGSMGQPIVYSSPDENKIVTIWTEYIIDSEEIDFVLFQTSNAALSFGTATVNLTSEATSYMNAVTSSFKMNVVDPESLKKEIRNLTDLQNVKNDLMGEYILRSNIDLSSVANWTPIGTSTAPFTGSLNGNGYSIQNLTSSNSGTNGIGLFGYVNGATFTNVAVTNVNVNGAQDVGGIVGKGIGVTMSKCFVTGTLEGNDHVGSLVGGIYGGGSSKIENCYSTATVNTRNYQAGGLAGVASSATFDKCYFAGTVASMATTLDWIHNAGGLIGLDEDANVFIYNTVSAASSVLGGTANPYVARGNEPTITNCLYLSDMTVSTPANDAGLAQPDVSNASELSDLKTQGTYTGLGWDFTTIWEIQPNQFPTLRGVGTITSLKPVNKAQYNTYVANGTLHVESLTNAEVSVYTASGSLVAKKSVVNSETAVKLPSEGVYLVRITENGNVTVQKVVNN